MNLLLKREEIKTASTGADLLRNKRDVLLNEFFSTIKALMTLRETLDIRSAEATQALAFALGLEGKEKLNSRAFIAPLAPALQINYKNLLGLKIPEITYEYRNNTRGENTFSLTSGQSVEDAKDVFSDFLKQILRILPQELKLKRLGQEIKSTTRKVNSLEKYVIPSLRAQVKAIREALEEREREDTFRLKRIKKKRLTKEGEK